MFFIFLQHLKRNDNDTNFIKMLNDRNNKRYNATKTFFFKKRVKP